MATPSGIISPLPVPSRKGLTVVDINQIFRGLVGEKGKLAQAGKEEIIGDIKLLRAGKTVGDIRLVLEKSLGKEKAGEFFGLAEKSLKQQIKNPLLALRTSL